MKFKPSRKSITILLAVLACLLLFWYFVFVPFKYKKFLIVEQQKFTGYIDTYSLTDNTSSPSMTIADYRDMITTAEINKKNINESEFNEKAVSARLVQFYADSQEYGLEQIDMLEIKSIIIRLNSVNQETQNTLTNTDNFALITDAFTASEDRLNGIKTDFTSLNFKPANQSIASAMQEYIDNTIAFYNDSAVVVKNLSTAQSQDNLDLTRKAQTEYKKIQNTYSLANAAITAKLTGGIASTQIRIQQSKATLISVQNALNTALMDESDYVKHIFDR